MKYYSAIKRNRDFPGGTVDKTPCCQCMGHGFNPLSGTKIQHSTQHGLKKELHFEFKCYQIDDINTISKNVKFYISTQRLAHECSFFLNVFIYLFLATLGLHCCARAFSSFIKQGLLFVAVHRLLVAVASFVVECGI